MKIGIFHTAFIGDILLSGLLVEVLFQGGHKPIMFAKYPHGLPFSQDPRVQRVVYVDKGRGWKKFFQMVSVIRLLRKENCDVLLVPHRSFTSTLCALFSGAKIRIGFDTASGSCLYTKTVEYKKNEHECLRLLPFATALGLKIPPQLPNHTILYADSKHQASLIARYPVLKNNFFVIAPGSAWATKKYPLSHWIGVLKEVKQYFPSWQGVILGGIDDKKDAQILLEHFPDFLNICGQLKLDESCVLVSMATCVLCNDSAPTHMASGFNIPVVAIFGPTIKAFGFGPMSTKSACVTYATQYGQALPCQPCGRHGSKKCPLKHHDCMGKLSPKTVIEQLNLLFEREEGNLHVTTHTI